jgi:hypothetical protein
MELSFVDRKFFYRFSPPSRHATSRTCIHLTDKKT